MEFKNKLGRIAMITAAVVICWLSLAGVAAARTAPSAIPSTGTSTGCAFRTFNGHYLTAVNGGGGTTDSIRTNETTIRSWEKFSIVGLGITGFAIQTSNGHWLTAVGGGGQNNNDAIHTNATVTRSWEIFKLPALSTGPDHYAIRTIGGNVLTAVDGGGRRTETIHTDTQVIRDWEDFTITCGH